jgi:Zn-dependent M28 family amino/carboxypeptidase
MKTIAPWLALSLAFSTGTVFSQTDPAEIVRDVPLVITTNGILDHIRVLASDEFEGRAPGSRGEEKTAAYIESEFKRLGLKPGNPDGTYRQKVPLVGFRANPSVSCVIAGQSMHLNFPDNCVVWSGHHTAETKLDPTDLVFVGYGVVAPEYGWDDYKDVDVRGKTIVMLVNDPAVPDPKDPSKLDDAMFKGKEMTYYGRWTYKFEIAAAKGAAAALIVHETVPAGYPYSVIMISAGRELCDLGNANGNTNRVAVEGWLNVETARRMMAAAGYDFHELKKTAVRRDFHPVSLNGTIRFDIKSTLRKVQSKNLIGLLEGADPALKNEYIIYTAHWDHLGRDPKLKGDQIFNGALDNASGVSGVIELARQFSSLRRRPRRSVLFLSVTAEEKGLLGSKYYAAHPLYPLNRTLADFNMDGLMPWGKTRDVSVTGSGRNTLEDLLAQAAAAQGRTVVPDTEPEKGGYFRSDQFEFAKAGVPALYYHAGLHYIGRPDDYGRRKIDDYISHNYHQVSDEIKPDWDMSGALDDLQLMFAVGLATANRPEWPVWKDGAEFKALREQQLQAAGRGK